MSKCNDTGPVLRSHSGFSAPSINVTSHNMSKLLPLRPVPIHRETIPSFLSRIAAMNGVSSADFAVDMGFSLKRVIQLEEAALRDLAVCGGLSQEQLEELVSWTGRGIGDVRMVFRDEVFVSRALRNPIIRGCPVCLREDIETDVARALSRMTMRGDWQLREISLCVKHGHPLVPLWEQRRLTDRYDLSSRFAEIGAEVREGKLEQSREAPSPYDVWLDTRLETGADDTWLADQSIYAATTFCRLLGTELLRLQPEPNLDADAQLRYVQAVGFSVAHQGEAAIRDALNALVALTEGNKHKPSKTFGRLYFELDRLHQNKDDFAPFRQILRDCIVDVWPVAAGDSVLGINQHERQLHSILTAEKEVNIGTVLLEHILVHAGAISADDARPVSRKTFDAKAYADLLAEIPTLVDLPEMCRTMGATPKQLVSLAEDGLLAPRIDIPKVKTLWCASDGITLVGELQKLAGLIEPSDKQWEGVQQAKKRSGLHIGTIIAALRGGKLQLGQRMDIKGYAGLYVQKSEIDQMRLQKQEPAYRNLITAAAFGRSVGIRTQGWFEKLVDAGHTPATRMPHPKWGGGERVYASPRDIEDFHKRFLTSVTMEKEFGQSRRILLAKLKAAEVKPFAKKGDDNGALYLREDVEAVIL